ncbi:sodium-dependent serotonin transporter-like [Epargyreus clarus]|uniref:sodium-dependent serotonin transporter-like n=1 Tax=Epargyreus clarus TaxID=520877 RepID=UPI003C2D959D
MSESVTTRSKTITDSSDTESVDEPLITDRWTNNISYRQLVLSTCIGIMQVWWHPYIHDFRRLLPFLFLYNVFSVFFGYPMFYLELALGVVTKKGVLNCWDMVPMARGIGFAMLAVCALSALALGAVGAWSLALLVHAAHGFLPWLHCAAAARPPCAARHRPRAADSETPAQSFFFNFVLQLKRDGFEGGLGNIVTELTVYYVICWILVYFITIKRIYSYSKLVLFKDVLAYFVLLCCGLGAIRLEGAGMMFHKCDWGVLLEDSKIWRDAIEYSLVQMSVSQGSLVMLGAYCPKLKQKLSNTALVAFAAAKTGSMASALLLGAAHGALHHDYDNDTNVWGGASSSIVLWADYVARIPGSQFWAALVFFSLFVLSLSSTALLVQTIMSAFSGRSIRKMTWAFLILICALFSIIGIITLCTQGGLHVLNFLLQWAVSRPRAALAAAAGAAVTYAYGQTAFCEDVYFAVGEYPCVFMRVCWALSPIILLITFISGMMVWPSAEVIVGWILVLSSTMPIIIVMLLYLIFKFRVRNIVGNEK